MTDSVINRTLLGLLPSTDYVVRVRSYNNFGVASDWSESLLVATQNVEVTGTITSVFNRIGAIVAQTGDYTAAEVTNAADLSSSQLQAFHGTINAPRLQGSTLTSSGYIGLTNGAPTSGTFATNDWAIDVTTPGIWYTAGGGVNPIDWVNLLSRFATSGIIPGQLIAIHQYAPSPGVNLTMNSNALTVLDSNNMTISFIVPPSGSVLVKLSALILLECLGGTSNALAMSFGLLSHNTSIQLGNTVVVGQTNNQSGTSSSVVKGAVTAPVLITGLTPNTSMQVDWAANFDGSSNVSLVTVGALTGKGTVSSFAPALLEVYAA